MNTMDALKLARDKIKNSPTVVKKKLKRDKVAEDWILNRENVQHGVTYNVKMLGTIAATNGQGQGCTDEGVEKLVQKHKAIQKNNEKLLKVSMTIDSKKMIVRDILTREMIEDLPIYRISYCTADPKYPKVFALIARQKATKELHTYAFLTNKKSMAEAISLTVAQGFTMAYEDWEEKSRKRKEEIESSQNEQAAELYSDMGIKKNSVRRKVNGDLIEMDDDDSEDEDADFNYVTSCLAPKTVEMTIEAPEEDNETSNNDNGDNDEDDFASFAKSRSKLDTGLVRKATFKGNVRDFLAVNVKDLEHATSTEDLSSKPTSPGDSAVDNTGDLISF